MLYSIAAILVLVVDQAVKYWTVRNIDPLTDQIVNLIPGVIHMTNVQNYGAAFSILENARWLLVAVSILFIIGIIALVSMDIIHTGFGRWMAVLVMAGALGNCIDRVLLGYVVDMFEFELFNFVVFNVADIFITVCGILFCIHVIIYREPEEERNAVPRPVKQKKLKRAPEPEYDEYDGGYEDGEEEEAPRRPARAARTKSRDKAKEDPYARIPRRSRHRSLDEDLRLPDPDDPFAEWGDEDTPQPPAKASARTRPAAGKAPGEKPAEEKASGDTPAPRTAPEGPEARPARRRTAPTMEDEWEDFDLVMPARREPEPAKRPAAAPAKKAADEKPAAPAKRQDEGEYEEYSLEDILSEFRDL